VIPGYVAIFRIHGPFLFGSTDKIDTISNRLSTLPPIVILRLRNMTAIDSTGLQALERLADLIHESKRELILCGAREQPLRLMHQTEFQEHIGVENMRASFADALHRAGELKGEMTHAECRETELSKTPG